MKFPRIAWKHAMAAVTVAGSVVVLLDKHHPQPATPKVIATASDDFGWSFIPATGSELRVSLLALGAEFPLIARVPLNNISALNALIAETLRRPRPPLRSGESLRLAYVSRGVSGEMFGLAGTLSAGFEVVATSGAVRTSWRETRHDAELDERSLLLVHEIDVRARIAVSDRLKGDNK